MPERTVIAITIGSNWRVKQPSRWPDFDRTRGSAPPSAMLRDCPGPMCMTACHAVWMAQSHCTGLLPGRFSSVFAARQARRGGPVVPKRHAREDVRKRKAQESGNNFRSLLDKPLLSGGALLMRPIVSLGLALALSGCGFQTWWNPPFTAGSNPNMPVSDSPNMQRILGERSPVDPITSEPGDIWPGQIATAPTLQDIERSGSNRGRRRRFPDRRSAAGSTRSCQRQVRTAAVPRHPRIWRPA